MPRNMTITRSGMTPEAIEELISQIGGNGNHGHNNGDGNPNGGNKGAKRDALVARV
ncbi:hypothetical protein Tco_0067833, partial [Tanacetum coccineum]